MQVNLLHIFRTPFPTKNTFGRLLLKPGLLLYFHHVVSFTLFPKMKSKSNNRRLNVNDVHYSCNELIILVLRWPKHLNLTVADYYILSNMWISDIRPHIWNSRPRILIFVEFEPGFADQNLSSNLRPRLLKSDIWSTNIANDFQTKSRLKSSAGYQEPWTRV